VELGSILHNYSTTCFIFRIIYPFLNLFIFIIKYLYYLLCQKQPAYKMKGGGVAREADSCVCGHLTCWQNINKNYGFQLWIERKFWLFDRGKTNSAMQAREITFVTTEILPEITIKFIIVISECTTCCTIPYLYVQPSWWTLGFKTCTRHHNLKYYFRKGVLCWLYGIIILKCTVQKT